MQNKDLKAECEECLDQTRTHETHTHEQVLLNLFDEIGLNSNPVTTGREVVKHIGKS